MNKRYLIIAVFFFIIAILCLIILFTKEFQTYAVTGAIVSALIGFAFLRRARNKYIR